MYAHKDMAAVEGAVALALPLYAHRDMAAAAVALAATKVRTAGDRRVAHAGCSVMVVVSTSAELS